MQDVTISAIVRVALERIAIFEDPARSVVAVDVDDQRIVGPFTNLMRQRRHILREGSHMIDVGRLGVRVGSARAAF